MDGQYLDIATSHVTARVLQVSLAHTVFVNLLRFCYVACVLAFDDQLFTVVWQTCVKWCSESERDAIFDVLQPHLLTLSCKKYAIFLVKKLIELGTFRTTLYTDQIMCGHVAMLECYMIV